MGNERGNYRRAILELVLVTGIFAVVSVFLLRIYLTADHLRGEAVAISTATVRAQGVADISFHSHHHGRWLVITWEVPLFR